MPGEPGIPRVRQTVILRQSARARVLYNHLEAMAAQTFEAFLPLKGQKFQVRR
jgi:hypothetical protein